MEDMAITPEPPYYAVIFTSKRTNLDDGYSETANRMVELASKQPGFLGIESVRNTSAGITVSYWKDQQSIQAWKEQVEHREAQRLGKKKWYE